MSTEFNKTNKLHPHFNFTHRIWFLSALHYTLTCSSGQDVWFEFSCIYCIYILHSQQFNGVFIPRFRGGILYIWMSLRLCVAYIWNLKLTANYPQFHFPCSKLICFNHIWNNFTIIWFKNFPSPIPVQLVTYRCCICIYSSC